MKRHFPTPLKINCAGLSRKRAVALADKLVEHFDTVESWDADEITAHKPLNGYHYEQAWNIIDRYGVTWQ